MKIVAVAFGLLGSIVPLLGAWLTLSHYATWGQWKLAHTLMLIASSTLELFVVATVGAFLLGKRRVALSVGMGTVVLIAVAVIFIWQLSKGMAAGWH